MQDRNVFSSKKKIAIDKHLYMQLAQAAEGAGYATTEEFILHVLEREASAIRDSSTDRAIEDRLRGLGYIE